MRLPQPNKQNGILISHLGIIILFMLLTILCIHLIALGFNLVTPVLIFAAALLIKFGI